MKAIHTKSLVFYQHLGRLWYAIAAADGKVREEEITQLKTLVKKEWLTVDDTNDRFGSDAAYQMEIVFDWLNINEDFSAKDCYDDFVSFKREHPNLFTEDINKLILKTSNAIADSFAGKNKSELMILANLNFELKKK